MIKVQTIKLTKDDHATIEVNETAFSGKSIHIDGPAEITIVSRVSDQSDEQ